VKVKRGKVKVQGRRIRRIVGKVPGGGNMVYEE